MQISTWGRTVAAFRSEDGRMVMVFETAGHGVLHSRDGKRYTQCYYTGGSCSTDLSEFGGQCIDPSDPKSHLSFQREKGSDQMTFNGVTYTLVETPEEITYDKLSGERRVQYFYRLADDRIFYASQLMFDELYPLSGWRAYLGTEQEMGFTTLLILVV